MSHGTELQGLLASVASFGGTHGQGILVNIEKAAEPLLLWVECLEKFSLTGHANELLVATRAAIRESAALAAIGAVRPCLFSLRAQIDLLLGWLFFKDHPIEYALVERTGEGFKLKRDVLLYLKDAFPGHGEKFGILSQVSKRGEIDPYKLLSAHIHAQSSYVVPKLESLKEIIGEKATVEECVNIQSDVSEFASDHLFATGIIGYKALPTSVVNSINARIASASAAQRSILFP